MHVVDVRKGFPRNTPRRLRAISPLMTVAVGSVLLSCVCSSLQAQSSGPKPAEFEVASVKLHDVGDQRTMMVVQPGGRFVAVNVSLRFVIRSAFQLQDDQVIGGPAWLATDRFDIEARSADPQGPPGAALLEMLQSLLAQRFKLSTHREMRELPVFAVERADSGSDQSPGFRVTECPDLTLDLSRPTPCANIRNGADFLALRGMPLNQFTQYLAPYVNRVLIDRTGLTERYDIDLKWAPEQQGPGLDAPGQARPDPDRPSLFTAIQEQLGLKLVSTTAMVEVLVIDTVDRPTPN